ncbi:MAG: TldD/PmbA family protein [Actinobacteria bacterium]|nr:TldD/PmbA family protein [Actinomycetota bacterium]
MPVSEGSPVTREQVRRAAQTVLDHPGADEVEVVVAASSTGVTRYAGSHIIQNISRNEVRAFVRVAHGNRVATTTTNQLDRPHMIAAAASALEAAKASPEDPDFPGFARPREVGTPAAAGRWDERTASASPRQRAEAVNLILRASGGASSAGIYETGSHSFGVVSSQGVDCWDAYTRCVTTCLLDNGEATGWGDDSSHAAGEVDVEAVARRAARKADAGRNADDAQPGTYEVVLEPSAVATMIEHLSYSGFGAKQMIEKESFLAARAGESVGAPSVTVTDDVWHPKSVGIGFDFEGAPRRRVPVIDSGTATGPVTDLRTARLLDSESTGHSSGSAEYGPYAANVVLEAGGDSPEDLIGGVDDGLLVTRFHYVNILDRTQTLLTGMTRDGLFRIRHGEIGGAVRNFRFAQSVLEALADVTGVGSDVGSFAPEYGSFGSTVAPTLRVGAFRFVSATSH